MSARREGGTAAGLLQEALAAAHEALQGSRASDRRLHAARKEVKKARAALRLLREGLSDAFYREENRALHDAGRCLSPLRDAKANVDVFEGLQKHFDGRMEEFDWAPTRRHLREDLLHVRRNVKPPADTLARADQILEDHVEALPMTRAYAIEPARVAHGFRRIYRKGRKAAKAVRREGTADALHEWRKQAKYLRHGLEGLDGARVHVVRDMADRAKALADHLGDDHDLFVLAERLSRPPYRPKDPEIAQRLLTLIGKRRARLQQKAMRVGHRLYDRKPGKTIAALLG